MPKKLALYEQLSVLHDEMANAAFALEWDKLILLEQKSTKLVQLIEQSASAITEQADREHTKTLIQHILEKQALIRDEIKVWKEDATPLLAVLNRSHPS